jgi:hypothetical protein
MSQQGKPAGFGHSHWWIRWGCIEFLRNLPFLPVGQFSKIPCLGKARENGEALE